MCDYGILKYLFFNILNTHIQFLEWKKIYIPEKKNVITIRANLADDAIRARPDLQTQDV